MAEIPIQEKRSRGVLPLIIALIVVAALIWYIMARRGEAKPVPAGLDSTRTGASPAAPGVMATHFDNDRTELTWRRGMSRKSLA
jgi:hypothetical protein